MPRTVAGRADTIEPLAEVFREHGYEGASLALISKATGLGKGSLYHVFPGGKDEMVCVVLDEIGGWFEARIYEPLRTCDGAGSAIAAMFEAVADYFRSGRRVCLVGVLAVSNARSRFAAAITNYFVRWVDALEVPLRRRGGSAADARLDAEEIVLAIQGAIILARALDNPAVFERAIERLRERFA